ncbi:MAG: low affinity iron permease family protein [Pirellulaceae bacterium]
MKRSRFDHLAKLASHVSGRPLTFLLAVGVVIIWGVSGPLFRFSDTWQLVINTGTTVVTFLMVFLIQNTQNRDSMAMQVKLDELIRAMKGAHTALLDLEELSEEELSQIMRNYQQLAAKAREELRRGNSDADSPEVEGLKRLQEESAPREMVDASSHSG